ncbi:hypothetical protein D3C78_1926990 [compost metagenome]
MPAGRQQNRVDRMAQTRLLGTCGVLVFMVQAPRWVVVVNQRSDRAPSTAKPPNSPNHNSNRTGRATAEATAHQPALRDAL